jgi:hypothetical protein
MKHFEKTAMQQLIDFIEVNNQAPLNIVYKKAKELLLTEAQQHEKLLTVEAESSVTLQAIRELLKGGASRGQSS